MVLASQLLHFPQQLQAVNSHRLVQTSIVISQATTFSIASIEMLSASCGSLTCLLQAASGRWDPQGWLEKWAADGAHHTLW